MVSERDDRGAKDAARYATWASVAMMAQQVAGRAASSTLFLAHFPLVLLPKAMAASAFLSAAGVFGFARVLSAMGPARAVPFVFGLNAALFFVEGALGSAFPEATALAVYGQTALFGATVTSAFWSLVNERFDPHTAKRIVSRITRGTTIGAVVGGLVTWRIGKALDAAAVPLGLGTLNAIAMALTSRIGRPRRDVPRTEAPSPFAILRTVRRTAYLRTLATLVALGALVQALLDYVLNAEAVGTLGHGDALLTFFAFFYTVTGVLSFVVQTALTRRALDAFGLAGSIAALPGVVAVASLGRLFLPPFASAVLLRGAESTARGSLYRAGYELLYAPLPAREKRATKALIDVGFDRLGSALGAGITGVVLFLPAAAASRTFTGLTVLFALVTFAVARSLHVGYVKVLEENLRSGVLELGKDEVLDTTTGRTVTETLDALDRKRVLRSLLAEVESLRTARTPAPSSAFLPYDEPSGHSLRAPSVPPAAPSMAALGRRTYELAASPVLQAIADVRSGERARVAAALARSDVPEALLVPHVVELLADDRVAAEVIGYLRSRVDRIAGQLVDRLTDDRLPADARRHVPRLLGAARVPRALAGLLAAQVDPDFDLRFRAALAAARFVVRDPAQKPDRDVVIALVLDEGKRIDDERPESPERRLDLADTGHRARLELLFTLLSLTMDREPLRLAFLSLLTGEDYLRGTALEYLGAVLPDEVRPLLWRLLGVAEPSVPGAPGTKARSERELSEELKESRHSLWSILPEDDDDEAF